MREFLEPGIKITECVALVRSALSSSVSFLSAQMGGFLCVSVMV